MTTPEAPLHAAPGDPNPLPTPDVLFGQTDWAALGHAFEPEYIDIADALTKLLGENPDARAGAIRDLREAAHHQNTIYPVTPSVAAYIAAIMPDGRTDVSVWHRREGRIRPLRAVLLDWLGELAHDVDDGALAAAQRHGFGISLAQAELRAMRPTLFRAVVVFVNDPDADVRHAAVTTALLLLDTPQERGRHRAELAPAIDHLLATSTNWYHRARALDTLDAWGENTVSLRQAERPREGDSWTSYFTTEPPF